jgi:hypothetical protein
LHEPRATKQVEEQATELDGVPTCAHDLLVADCRVYAIAEYIKTHPERRMMDVTVRCAHCRARFRFRAPGGLSPSDPRCSILGDILHCPIEPAPDLPLWDGKDPEDFGGGG